MKSIPAPPIPEKISDYVFYHTDDHPSREALVWQDVRYDYGQLAKMVKEVSKALIAYGIGHGDRVALLGPPRPEFFIVMMATVDIGAIWMGMHPRYKLAEFQHVVATAMPKIIFAFSEIDGRSYQTELATLESEYSCINEIVIFDQPLGDQRMAENIDTGISYADFLCQGNEITGKQWQSRRDRVKADDSAVIIFTSGTTGRPKAAMNSHFGLIHCGRIELSRWPSESLRVLQNMPINHIANIGMMSSYSLIAGGTLVFMDRFDTGDILKVIENEKITFWLQAPAMFHLVMNDPEFVRTDLSSLQYIIWGGGPMPQHMVESLGQLDATLGMAYGMTELTAYASYSDLDASIEVLANTIGKPEPRYNLRLMKSDGKNAKPGESGEIQA